MALLHYKYNIALVSYLGYGIFWLLVVTWFYIGSQYGAGGPLPAFWEWVWLIECILIISFFAAFISSMLAYIKHRKCLFVNMVSILILGVFYLNVQ